MNFKKYIQKFIKKICILLIITILLTPFCVNANTDIPEVLSPSCILIDATNGKVIYEKNSQTQMYPASTTKIMTAILTIENCNLNDIATVSKTAISSKYVPEGYTNAKLQHGENFTIAQLLDAMLIPSANDAANVLAEHISGSIDEFSNLMNLKASELGCTKTHFVNPSGLHNSSHVSTAYDLSLIAKYAMQNETFRNIVCKTSCYLPPTDIYPNDDRKFDTTNELLKDEKNSDFNYFYEYANGIKTGYTEYANNCIVAGAKKDNTQLICVVLGADDDFYYESKRAVDCRNLFNYAFSNYNEKTFLSEDTILKQIEFDTINISNQSEKKILDIVPEKSLVLKTTTDPKDITPIQTINDDLSLPIIKGSIVGKIEYDIDNNHYSINLIANDTILNSSFMNYLFDFLIIFFLVFILLYILKFINGKKTKKQKDKTISSFDYKKLK